MNTRTSVGRLGRHDDLALRAKPTEWLTLEEMRRSLPAIFAPQPHESRSERYVYISTADLLEELTKRDFMPVEARVSRSRVEGRQAFARHMVRLRAKGDFEARSERRVGDTSFEVIMVNSHDGSSRYRFMAGLLKLLCLNGLVASDGTVENVSVLHAGNRRRQLDEVVAGAHTVLEQGPKLIDTVKSWQEIELKEDERMAFADSARTLRFGDSKGKVITPITAQQLLIPRRYQETGKNDLWSTFNVVQENSIRGGLSAIGDRVNRYGTRVRSTTREVRAIDGDVKLNKALWQLAEKMAELKK